MLILFLLKQLIDFLWNIKAKYYDIETLAYDEIIKDVRDYEIAWDITQDFPETFIYKPRRIFNQSQDWYRSSCTAQWTAWWADVIRKYKADKTFNSPFTLWDTVKSLWLWSEKYWAFLIDTIKVAKDNLFIDWYYRVATIDWIKSALYRWDLIVTWSNKINWKTLQTTWYVVDKVDKWNWHAFYISWWNKEWFIAVNSYSEKYWNKWTFTIPFKLFLWVSFNSTYAITINPKWATLTREELYDTYKIIKKY